MPTFPPSNGGGTFYVPPNTVNVAINGDDANDGVNRPVRTVMRGVQAVQALGGGVVLFEDGCVASPNTGCGLQLYGGNNKGVNTPGGSAGPNWVSVSHPMRIACVNPKTTGTQAWPTGIWTTQGSGSFTTPTLEIAGSFVPIEFDNVFFFNDSTTVQPCVRLGYSSPLPAWDAGTTYNSTQYAALYSGAAYDVINNTVPPGTLPTNATYWRESRPSFVNSGANALSGSSTAQVMFNQCFARRDGDHKGPTIDVGSAFWCYYNNCSIVRVCTDLSDHLNNCSVRFVSQSMGQAYLQFFNALNLSTGGIYSNGGSSGVIDICTMEGNGSNSQPVLYCENGATTGPDAALNSGQYTNWSVFSATGADTNDPTLVNYSSGIVIANQCAGQVLGYVKSIDGSLNAESMTTDLLYGESYGQTLLQHDSSRRTYGPSATAYPNIAYQFNPTVNSFTEAPDGTTTALVNDNSHSHVLIDEQVVAQQVSDGDRVMFGLWMRWDNQAGEGGTLIANKGTGDLVLYIGGNARGMNRQVTLAPNDYYSWVPYTSFSVGQWVYLWGWLKVVSHGTGKLYISGSAGSAGASWRPYAGIVPAGETHTSDSEVAYLAMHLAPPPGYRPDAGGIVSPSAGAVAFWKGQKLAFWDQTLQSVKYLDIDNGAVRIT